jgi:hypothetical protein
MPRIRRLASVTEVQNRTFMASATASEGPTAPPLNSRCYLEGPMKRKSISRISISCFAVLFIPFASGCAGSSSVQSNDLPATSVAPTTQIVTISPKSLQIKRGASWNFSASVSNAIDQTVTWRTGLSGGSITDAGVYTAPAVDGIDYVVATSKTDPTKTDSATVTVAAFVFSLTGNSASARFGHTATLLPNGQVFIAGGAVDQRMYGHPALVERAERFDPTSQTFQPAGTVARHDHSATLLANGDVLLAGGITDWSPSGDPIPTATAQLLKAGSGQLQPTGSMSALRSGHTSTLLQDGRVLIAGGEVVTETGLRLTRTAELYDPASATFVAAGNMIVARIFHTATLLSTGKVLITGWGGPAELFDPATNSFTATVGASAVRFDATATLLADGRVLIAGGDIDYDIPYVGPSELFDPTTGQFTSTGSLTTPRWSHTATLLPDGTVLIAGGVSGASDAPTTAAEIYHPATGSFTTTVPMMRARTGHTANLLADGSVLFTGGISDSSAEIYH